MLFGCARTIPSRRSGWLLRFREFQAVRGTDCLLWQEILRGIQPPLGIDLFLLFLADSGPGRHVRFGNEHQKPKNRGMARCGGCASVSHSA